MIRRKLYGANSRRDRTGDMTIPTTGTPRVLEDWQPPDWYADAVCATVDPELFYPEKGGTTRYAKAICAGCSVATECLQYALDRHENHGIWGGHSERERRKIRQDREVA